MGTMQQIRDRLVEGESAADIIADGHAPSSVYKAVRQVRGNGKMDSIAKPHRRTTAHNTEVVKPMAAAVSQPEPKQLVAYEDLEEERDALREEVEGLRASARQLKTTLAQAVAHAAALHEETMQLRSDLAERDSNIVALEQEAEALKGAVHAAQSRIPSHPPGLCQEASCEDCVAQGQEIAMAAYTRGRGDVLTYMDESLVAADRFHPVPAGEEPLRQRVATALFENQPITIIDDRTEQQRAHDELMSKKVVILAG